MSKDEIGQLAEAHQVMLSGITSVISRLQQVNQNLKLSEERWQLALEGSSDGLWDWDIPTGLVFLSCRAQHLLGLEQTDKLLPLRHCLQQVMPEDRKQLSLLIRRHLKGKYPLLRAEFRVATAEGPSWRLLKGDSLRTEDGCRPLRMVGSLSNIQYRKNAERQLREANEQLESKVQERTQALAQSNQQLTQTLEQLRSAQEHVLQAEKQAALGILVSGIAHELNTPLGISITASSHAQQLLQETQEFLNAPAVSRQQLQGHMELLAQSLQLLEDNLGRSADLVRRFRTVDVENSSASQWFDVKQYLYAIAHSLENELNYTPHHLSISCPDHVQLFGPPTAFSQIITNLIRNSLQHAFPNKQTGELTLEVRPAETSLELIYSDNGVGMTPEVLAKIFDPFFTTKRGQGGTGLGLYILYSLTTKSFRGSVTCQSEPGQGARFLFSFPLKEEAAPVTPLQGGS